MPTTRRARIRSSTPALTGHDAHVLCHGGTLLGFATPLEPAPHKLDMEACREAWRRHGRALLAWIGRGAKLEEAPFTNVGAPDLQPGEVPWALEEFGPP